MKKFKGKYRTDSKRLKDWDYSTPGGYFVTICTHKKRAHFGKVIDGDLLLSPIGRIVSNEWKVSDRLHESVELDEYIIMPNHLHGVIILHEVVEAGVSADRYQKTNYSQHNN